MSIKLAISGICGRMGSEIARLAAQDRQFEIVGALESPGHPCVGRPVNSCLGLNGVRAMVQDEVEAALRSAQLLIEFTTPQATAAHLAACVRMKKAIVIGTTGLEDEQMERVRKAGRKIGVVYSPNMSVGVNQLFELTRQTAERLGLAYDVEIVEAHHRMKKDAPSGTAKRLAELIAQARGQTADRVPVHAIRAGDIVGDHTVIFSTPGERLELTHRAHSRATFAAGALAAARFLASRRRAGLYSMRDVLAAS